jgi:hypothetical protein
LGECDDDQLAAWLKQSPKASTFRVQVYTARTFGILEGDGAKHKLTELGRVIVDPNQTLEGRARSFLTVPLYKAGFEKYKGGVLPPAAALERDFVALGVAEKQKERARKILERSADQAGFVDARNRSWATGAGRPKSRSRQWWCCFELFLSHKQTGQRSIGQNGCRQQPTSST